MNTIKNKQYVNKIKSAERLLCRTWPLPCKSGKTSGCNLLPCFARARPGFCKSYYALATLIGQLVLPDFARSLSADAFINRNIFVSNQKQKSVMARRKTGPGSLACGRKVFSGLIFGYFPSKGK